MTQRQYLPDIWRACTTCCWIKSRSSSVASNAVGRTLNDLVNDVATTSMLLSNVGAEASHALNQAVHEASRIKETIKDVAGSAVDQVPV